jgi:hypothetical protein
VILTLRLRKTKVKFDLFLFSLLNNLRETSVEGKYREANDGEYWGCTAGVGHGNMGSRDYEECNIPEIHFTFCDINTEAT